MVLSVSWVGALRPAARGRGGVRPAASWKSPRQPGIRSSEEKILADHPPLPQTAAGPSQVIAPMLVRRVARSDCAVPVHPSTPHHQPAAA